MKKLLIAGLLVTLAACGETDSETYDIENPIANFIGDGLPFEPKSVEASPSTFDIDKPDFPGF